MYRNNGVYVNHILRSAIIGTASHIFVASFPLTQKTIYFILLPSKNNTLSTKSRILFIHPDAESGYIVSGSFYGGTGIENLYS
jgi:hypothetical protein